MNNPNYKNKTLNSFVNIIYDTLVFVSCFVLFGWTFVIISIWGVYSKAYFIYIIPMLILIYHTIMVRITREDICNALIKEKKELNNGGHKKWQKHKTS